MDDDLSQTTHFRIIIMVNETLTVLLAGGVGSLRPTLMGRNRHSNNVSIGIADSLMSQPMILLIDDDAAVVRALEAVGRCMKLPMRAFSFAESFLKSEFLTVEGCLILDIRLHGLSGLELQAELKRRRCDLPIIVISGHADVPLAVEAMTRGAVTVLEKPFALDQLIQHIRLAQELGLARQETARTHQEAQNRLAQLTSREIEVANLIAQGLTNKEIAKQLKLSLRAIEDRRARLMRRLNAHSIAELIQTLKRARDEL